MFWWEYLRRALAEDLALNKDLWINPEVFSYFSGFNMTGIDEVRKVLNSVNIFCVEVHMVSWIHPKLTRCIKKTTILLEAKRL